MSIVPYINVISAARDTVQKMIAQRSNAFCVITVTTGGGKTAAVHR